MRTTRIRKNVMLLTGGAALALPVIDAAAAAAASSSSQAHAATAASATYKGVSVPASQWGNVTVSVTQVTSTAGGKVTRKFSDLGGGYTYHTSRSQYIMSQALPLLRQEFLVAQSARIQNVSGATYTTRAFIQSLQSALLKAHA